MRPKRVFAMSDVHNDYIHFMQMLREIHFSPQDELYIVGDVFDRGVQPVELYKEIRRRNNIHVIRGNHDQWLADYINSYFSGTYRGEYYYNTFRILRSRLYDDEIKEIADWIESLPYYLEIEVDGQKYQLGHAATTENPMDADFGFFLMGDKCNYDTYLYQGIKDCISVIGHVSTEIIRMWVHENQVAPYQIWTNYSGNVIALDCGNGYRGKDSSSALGCICLNDGECYYV